MSSREKSISEIIDVHSKIYISLNSKTAWSIEVLVSFGLFIIKWQGIAYKIILYHVES